MDNRLRVSQNFLRNPHVVKRLLSQTNITNQDIVYDIGSGKGIIADCLAGVCKAVVCVELDTALANKLTRNLVHHDNVVVYEADFLALPLPQTPFKVFANIPFNMSADILRRFTDAPNPPVTAYLIVQREFAQKLVPGGTTYHSQLSVLLNAEFNVRIVDTLRKEDFYPSPKVETALIEINRREKPLVPTEGLQLFRDFVVYAYNEFQPTLAEALRHIFSPDEFCRVRQDLGIAMDSKPSSLRPEQWIGLFSAAARRHELLIKTVDGFEIALAKRHRKHTRLHRTRR